MHIDIWTAIIAGAFTIFGPIITFYFTKKVELGLFESIPTDRSAGLEGKWKGIGTQEIYVEGISPEMEVSIALSVKGKEIVGTTDVWVIYNEQKIHLVGNVKGGFMYDRFLQLTYKNSKSSAIQFGSLVLELDGIGESVEGRFVGYGTISETIVHGTLNLKKEI